MRMPGHHTECDPGHSGVPYDAMIAATAIANRLSLYTVDPGDLEGMAGLTWPRPPTQTSADARHSAGVRGYPAELVSLHVLGHAPARGGGNRTPNRGGNLILSLRSRRAPGVDVVRRFAGSRRIPYRNITYGF